MCVCVCACGKKKVKFNSKAISWFWRKFAPSKISRYTVLGAGDNLHVHIFMPGLNTCGLQSKLLITPLSE